MNDNYTKKDLLYSMLLNIRDGINSAISDFETDESKINWKEIFENLNEKEAELVYILENIKSKSSENETDE